MHYTTTEEDTKKEFREKHVASDIKIRRS